MLFFNGLFFFFSNFPWGGQQTSMEAQGDMARMAENYELSNVGGRRSRDEEHESRSGSDNMEGASGDDQDASDKPPRKKRYHRHTPQQIQELEAYAALLFFLCSRTPFFLHKDCFLFLSVLNLVFCFHGLLVCSKNVPILMKSKG